jgi:predicted CXXCH cytochrome family protein
VTLKLCAVFLLGVALVSPEPATAWQSAIGASVGLAADEIPQDLSKYPSCSTSDCHPDMAKGRYVHGPVAVLQCTVCHQQSNPSRHQFLADHAATTCSSCHELNLRDLVHQPVLDGNCLACHDPHHSEVPFLLKTSSEAQACGQCHEQSQGLDKKFVHGPVAVGACSLCHDPHSSYYSNLLNKQGTDACLNCHTAFEQHLRGSQFWHRPVSEDCSHCHDAHASDHPYQLKDEPRTMCLDCHQAKRSEIESATNFHAALTTQEGCSNCHRTHASRFPKLLDQPVIDVCLQCHDRPQVRPDGSVVAAVGDELENSRFLHGPIREGDCTSCHNPHGSKNFRMLHEEYPQQFYAPFDIATYNLCFRCHESRVFTAPTTTTLTRFRNGDVNLHYLHVNKSTKGRTCRACHKSHASNLPQHMAEKVPFGGWEIPINYKDLPTGGSCAPGCHAPKSYDFVRPLPGFQLLPVDQSADRDR